MKIGWLMCVEVTVCYIIVVFLRHVYLWLIILLMIKNSGCGWVICKESFNTHVTINDSRDLISSSRETHISLSLYVWAIYSTCNAMHKDRTNKAINFYLQTDTHTRTYNMYMNNNIRSNSTKKAIANQLW